VEKHIVDAENRHDCALGETLPLGALFICLKLNNPIASITAVGVVATKGDRNELVPASRLLTKSASGVLASLRGSTYGTEYASASSLAAALLDGLSEQPAGYADGIRDLRRDAISEVVTGFVNTLLGTPSRTDIQSLSIPAADTCSLTIK
jgi:hypothetical protein